MGLRSQRWLLSAGFLMSVSLSHAQSTIGAVTTAPNNTSSVSASIQFNSVFTQYHVFTEQSVLPWRDANDDVGKIGGWHYYAKEASKPDAADKPNGPKYDSEMMQPAGPPNGADSHSGHGRKP